MYWDDISRCHYENIFLVNFPYRTQNGWKIFFLFLAVNYLLTVTLQSLGSALPEVKVILGSRSELSQSLSLHEAFREAARRVCSLFYRDTKGRRPVHGEFTQEKLIGIWMKLPSFVVLWAGILPSNSWAWLLSNLMVMQLSLHYIDGSFDFNSLSPGDAAVILD